MEDTDSKGRFKLSAIHPVAEEIVAQSGWARVSGELSHTNPKHHSRLEL